MIVRYHRNFLKAFKRRIIPFPNLDKKFHHRFNLFLSDARNPELKDHRLIGEKSEYRSFSITGDIRVVYRQLSKTEVEFYDIGTHNQVY